MPARFNVEPVITLLKELSGGKLVVPEVNPTAWNQPWKPELSNRTKLRAELPTRFSCNADALSWIEGFLLRGTIGGVPVDDRRVACEIFESWARDKTHSPFVGVGDGTRVARERDVCRPLLCTAAAGGSGKSVMQAFNLVLFKQRFGGLPIEVTFTAIG